MFFLIFQDNIFNFYLKIFIFITNVFTFFKHSVVDFKKYSIK